jgi:hypothetical protein
VLSKIFSMNAIQRILCNIVAITQCMDSLVDNARIWRKPRWHPDGLDRRIVTLTIVFPPTMRGDVI